MDGEPLLALNFLNLLGEVIHDWSKLFSKLVKRNELTRMMKTYGNGVIVELGLFI
jgi:hypothetical protein